MRSDRFDGQGRFRALRGGWRRVSFGLVDVFLHCGQLRFDSGEVFLRVGEGLGVAERLADALLGVIAFGFGAGEVAAGLLE